MNNAGTLSKAIHIRLPGRIKTEDKINFARHLSIVIRAGLPLLEGLKIIRRQTESKELARVIDQVVEDVNNGQFLATSLEKFHRHFDDFFVNIIRVGEVSGTLAGNLAYLAEETKKSKDLRGKVRAAMIYPMVVLGVMMAVVGFLVFFVFPKVLPIFENLKVKLPLATKVLIFTSQFALNYWFYILGAVLLLVVGLRLLLKLPDFRMAYHRLLLHLPLISGLIREMNAANSARILAVLLKSGIKIVEAVSITANTSNNLVYRRAFLEAAEDIRRGEPMAKYLSAHKRIFPPLMSGLIEIGENTGNLESNLNYISEYYSEEVDLRLKNMTVLLEPLLLLILGLIVGFVSLAIILPIYQITQGVR